MIHNDILRRLRYIFDFNDAKMIAIFSLADEQVTQSQVSNWLKKEEDSDFQQLSDRQLAVFLNGLINDKRGKKEGAQRPPEKKINNNIIFNKLKIALNLRAEDVLDIMNLGYILIDRNWAKKYKFELFSDRFRLSLSHLNLY